MTYVQLKTVVSALLTGDTQIPDDEQEFLALLNYAFMEIANLADAMRLFTDDVNEQIVRMGIGGKFVRMPRMPEKENSELDIDEPLAFAVARLIASKLSTRKYEIHVAEARSIITKYNENVYAYMDKIDEQMDPYYEYGSFNNPEDNIKGRLWSK